MRGKIVKGIAGFYYIKAEDGETYQCKAKGIFRKEQQKPLVGDEVEIRILHEADREGNLEAILPRKNSLIRPAVANVDQALVIFAVTDPRPNFMLLDRFLVMMESLEIPTVICLNKKDLASEEEIQEITEIYGGCGYEILLTSAAQGEGIDSLREILRDKISVVAGPSGVGKSSLINRLQDEVSMETGEISKKLGRGKHTTRHAQLITVAENTYIMDTPGFSSLYVDQMEKEELKDYFREFRPHEGKCRFLGCVHIHEPDCSVKRALSDGMISPVRYRNYVELYNELKEKRRY